MQRLRSASVEAMADKGRAPDLTAFLRALAPSAELEPSVDVDEIAVVESAWQIPHTVVSSHGWVLELRDGKRLYLEYTLDDSRPGARKEVAMTPLDAETVYPDLENDAGAFWYRPDHINAHLGITPPPLH